MTPLSPAAHLRRFFTGSRWWIMVVLALAVIAWNWFTDPDKGAPQGTVIMARLQWLGLVVLCAAPTYLIRRALLGRTRSREVCAEMMRGNVAAGIGYAGICVLSGMVFLGVVNMAHATELPKSEISQVPPNAVALLPVLQSEQRARWPDMPDPPALGAQVEQESCVSLKSTRCWSPRAELKTSREYGFGLGQITITSRFDNFAAARGLDPSLHGWEFADRFDPARQLRVLVLMDRNSYQALRALPAGRERLAMAFVAYNGGLGGLQADRQLCAKIPGCDPARWFGHVEQHSLKSRVKQPGYGQSFFDISRGYPIALLVVRYPRYVSALAPRAGGA